MLEKEETEESMFETYTETFRISIVSDASHFK